MAANDPADGGGAFGDEGDAGGGDFDDFGEGAEGEGEIDGESATDVESDVIEGDGLEATAGGLEAIAAGGEGGEVVDAGFVGGGFGGDPGEGFSGCYGCCGDGGAGGVEDGAGDVSLRLGVTGGDEEEQGETRHRLSSRTHQEGCFSVLA